MNDRRSTSFQRFCLALVGALGLMSLAGDVFSAEKPNIVLILAAERGYTNHNQPGELFNVREDLTERHNLFGERPQLISELKSLLQEYKREGRSTPGEPQKNDVEIQEFSPRPAPGKSNPMR